MKIGVLDSGIGGITVLKELIKESPNNEYIYFGDSINLPYGNKTKEQLQKLGSNIIEFMIRKNVDKIIIACGTLSANVYEYLKEKYEVEIYDVINPCVNYILNSDYKKVGVMATAMTVKSHTFLKKLESKKNLQVLEVPCPELVNIIENNKTNLIEEKLEEYLKSLKENNIDALVLGCTHYPILKDYIDKYFKGKVDLINMGEVISKKLKNGGEKQKIEMYFSKLDSNLLNNVKNILGDITIEFKERNLNDEEFIK